MSRDPFEEMQNRNPVTRDELPMGPMSVAERILGHRSRGAMPGWAMATAAAFLVAAVGGGLLLFLNGGAADLPVGSGGTTTSVPDVSTTTVPTMETDAVVYFFLGESLVPVSVTVEVRQYPSAEEQAPDLAMEVMTRLLEGAGEESLSSAIPEGVQLHGFGFGNGIAEVYLSSEFVSGGGSASMIGRVGQVVYSLTAVEGVEGVVFYIFEEPPLGILGNEMPTTIFGGEGFIVDLPATREGFDDLLPAVMIESPAYGAEAPSPIVVKGTANVFEATVSIELLDASGAVLFEGFTTASCGTGCRGEWIIDAIPYQVTAAQWGTLRAFESSAEDGQPINVREHPVFLTPSSGSTDTTVTTLAPLGCSGHFWETPFAEQEGLPAAVASKRAAIWDAAVECDWDQLQRLLGPGFSYTFGGGDDSIDAPIHHWQGLEDDEEDPIRFLAELLNQPFGTIESEGITYYVWPSVHTKAWEDVTDAEREALRPLFDEADFADFEAFGAYFHYRIGILANGDWVYFIAGD